MARGTKVEPRTMKVSLFNRIEDVDPTQWDATGRDVFSSHAMLTALEKARLPGVRMWYATLESGSGRMIAAAPITRIEVDAHHLTHGLFRSLIGLVRTGYPGFLRTRLMVCGTPLSVGNPPVRSCNGRYGRSVFKELAGVICELGRHERARWHIFKEFDAEHLAMATDSLRAAPQGWLFVPSEPNAHLDINWDSYAEYLASLRSHYRYKIHSAARRMIRAGVSVHIARLADAYDESLHQLYDSVLDRAAIQFERLTPQFFFRLGHAFGDSAQLLLFLRDGQPIGWVAVLLDGDHAYDLFHGIDYSVNDETALYFNQIGETLRFAIASGARRLSLGQSSEVVKARFGARSVALWIGLQHQSRTVTAMLRHGRRWLFPEKTVPRRHVFHGTCNRDAKRRRADPFSRAIAAQSP